MRWRPTAPRSWSDLRRRSRNAARAALEPVPSTSQADQQLSFPLWVGGGMRRRLGPPGARRLLVLHVPKTGGTSLRLMLSAHGTAANTFVGTGEHGWFDLSIAELRTYDLFVGHTFLEPLYLFPDDDWVTALVVREPVSWWASWYAFRRQRLLADGRTSHPIASLPMGEWLDTRADEDLANAQTSWLLARTRIMFDNPDVPGGRLSATGAAVLRRRPEPALGLLDRILDRTTVVGVTDDLHSVYLGVCRAMGWEPAHGSAVVANASSSERGVTTLSPVQQERLLDLNRLDQHAYDRARQLSRERAAQN